MRRITAQGHYGMSVQDLCEATGQSLMDVSKQLYRLGQQGKAFSDGRGGALRYYLFADAREKPADVATLAHSGTAAPALDAELRR